MKITEKYIPNLIFSILLIFSIIGTASLTILRYYIINETTLIESYEENNIPQKAMEEIEEYFKDSEDYSGIPSSVYMSAITEDDIRNIIDAKIINLFTDITGENRERVNFDFTALENSISDYFDKFAQENNVEVDEAYKNQLQKTIDTAKSEIEDFADIYLMSFIGKESIISKVSSIYKYLSPIMFVCIGLALVCIILIAVVSRKKFRFAIYWYSMAAVCSSVLMLIPTLYIKISGITDKLIIRNECVYSAVTGYISNVLNMLTDIEFFMLGIGLILILIYALVSNFKKSK